MDCAVCGKEVFVRNASSGEARVCGSCVLSPIDAKPKKGKTAKELNVALFEESKKPESRGEKKEPIMAAKPLKVKSNYARNRVVVLRGQCVLSFDENGEATMPAHQKHLLELEMKHRPGRYTIAQDPTPKKPTPKPVEVEGKLPEKVESPDELALPPAPEPEKKAPKKRKSKKSTKKKTSKKKSDGEES
jgi:hypothetical protein